jgi:hypothetical protein
MIRYRVLILSVVAVCGAFATPAWSDGDQFFLSKEIPGHPKYVLFGNVKDENDRYVKDAIVQVHVAQHMINVETQTDVIGRYRAPDVGRVIEDMGYEIDPALITVSVYYPGYHIAHRESRGKFRQKKGAIEMNFRLQKNGAK